MISSPKTANPESDVGNIQPQKIANNTRAVPLPYYAGRRVLPLIWGQSNVYNPQSSPITKKIGKSNQTTGFDQYGDLFGLVSCARTDYLEAIEFAGEIIWAGGISRDVAHPHHTGDIVVPGYGTFRMYWGTSAQPLDTLVLSTCGEEHPRYPDQCFMVVKKCYFGSNNTTPPNIRVIVERAAFVDGMPIDRTREGTNLVTALAEIISDDWFGLARPDLINPADWFDFADSTRRNQTVAVPENPTHLAAMGFGSPYLERVQAAKGFFGAILEHFDGYLRRTGTQLEIGQFPHDGIIPPDLPELTYHDFIETPIFDSDEDDADAITDAFVTHIDRDNAHEEDTQPGPNPAARARLGEIREKTFKRPFLVTSYQAREQANELSKFYSRPEETCTVPVRRERIVGLRAGDRFILNDAPSQLRQVVRITRRRDDADGGRVTLSLVAERGLAPLGYTPVPQPLPELPSPDLVPIVNARIFQLPSLFADYAPAPALVALADRPAAHTTGFTVHLSTAGVTYDQIATVDRWSLRAALAAGISAASATCIVNAAGFDLPLLSDQSAPAQLDDTLLLIVGYEIHSIGDVTALGGGQYQLALLRGRRGSAATAHLAGAICYIIPRAQLTVLQHADFPRTTVDRYFKLATYTPDEEQDLSDALALTLTFDATGVADPAPLTATARAEAIFLAWLYPNPPDPTLVATDLWERTAATPAPVPGTDLPTFSLLATGFNRGGLAPGATRYYWAQNRDTIGRSALIGPVNATAAAAPTGAPGAPGAPGTPGTPGTDGTDGINGDDGIFREFVWRRSPTAPATPTGNGIPAGWSDDPPAGADPLWMSVAKQELDGTLLFGEFWSAPIRHDGPPGLNGTNGTNGTDGTSVRRIYLRSALVPATPIGNAPAGWTAYIPSGSATDAVWASDATFNSAGTLVGSWSTPERLSGSVIFYTSGAPTGHTLIDGDTYFDLADNNKIYSRTGGSWVARFQPLLRLDGSNNITGLVKADGTDRDFVLVADKFQVWNGVSPEVPFEIVGGAVYIKDAFIQNIAAGKITAGSIDAALSLTTGGAFTARSGYTRFHVDPAGAIFGDPSTQHIKFDGYSGNNSMSFYDGATYKGGLSYSAFLGALNLSFANAGFSAISGVNTINTQNLYALGTADPRTSDAPLNTAGGAWIAKTLDVRGRAYLNDELDLASHLNLGASLRKITPDSWTPPLFDGANNISHQWSSGQIRFLVGGTDVGGITPA